MLATVMTVLGIAVQAFPILIETGANLKPFAESLFKQYKGDELTETERADLYAAVDAQYDKAMQPLPPPQPGDPDYVKPSGA